MNDDLSRASQLMSRFADRTALTSDRDGPRRLWIDALAVRNLIALAQTSGDASFELLAAGLVGKVHETLGRYRAGDVRTGWLSGLADDEALRRPTAGGLRIGNRLPERTASEPSDAREWERDGQCFHCLTKWVLALERTAWRSGDASMLRAARELVLVAQQEFVRGRKSERRLSWKMSTDLSRPLVDLMCPHDPVDGYIVCLELDATARELGWPAEPALASARDDFASMVDVDELPTADRLGAGQLLFDAWRLAQVDAGSPLVASLLHAARIGIEPLAGLALPTVARERLPLRDLGFANGLAAAAALSEQGDLDRAAQDELSALQGTLPLRHELVRFWLDDERRQSASWLERRDIHDVLLVTCLCPLSLLDPARRSRARSCADPTSLLRTLRTCIDVCLDAERGFDLAAGDANDPELRSLFHDFAEQRGAFAHALEETIPRPRDLPDSAAVALRAARCRTLTLRRALEGRTDAFLVRECAREESATADAYDRALSATALEAVPPAIRTLLLEQRAALGGARDASERGPPSSAS